LYYTGFLKKMKQAITPKLIKTKDILGQGNQHMRKVFNCFVIGKAGCGKSTFLDAVINKSEL